MAQTLKTICIWLAIWLIPLGALALSGQTFLTELSLFFSKLAVVTFGGAYAVLAYMTQAVVEDYSWLTLPEMMDALGLAETTPGPLILVTEFVGLLAGYREGGIAMAVIAGVVTLWMTFAPCFLWIFAGAPYIDWIASRPQLSGALQAITAAVVGVILNLSLWFATHVFFADVGLTNFGAFRVLTPELSSLNITALGLGLLAAYLLLMRKMNLIAVLGLSGLVSLGLGLL